MKGADEESLALAHVRGQGLRLVARNWRCKGGELDLVLEDGETLVIAEVRKRSHAAFGSAAESVDARKRSRLIHAAQLFLSAHPQHARRPVRFDVLALDGANRLDWIRGAFDADGV